MSQSFYVGLEADSLSKYKVVKKSNTVLNSNLDTTLHTKGYRKMCEAAMAIEVSAIRNEDVPNFYAQKRSVTLRA